MKLRYEGFRGELPHVRPRLLPPGYGEAAVNCLLDDGSLRPFPKPLLTRGLAADAQTIFRDGDDWIAWDAVVDLERGPVAASRLYITGDGAPKVRLNALVTKALGVPAPTPKPAVALIGVPVDADSDPETIVYASTYVTDIGEESAPSVVSDKLLWRPNQEVLLTFADAVGSAIPANRGITWRRVYRSQTSAAGVTDLYFVAQVAAVSPTYTHNLTTAPLQEIIPSTNYDLPPAGMRGITGMPNGMMVAFEGRELLFCEPYQPHAWPRAYRLIVDHPIVALCSFGSMLAVLTEGTPYIAQGTSPDTVVLEKVEAGLPCVAARGVVDMGYSAVYPSTEGLVAISAGGAPQVITRNLFTRDQWRKLNPTTFRAAAYDGRYVFSHNPGGGRTVGMIDLTGETPFLIRSDIAAEALFRDDLTGELFWLDGPRRIMLWDAEDAPGMTLRWRSGEAMLDTPTNFGAMLVDLDHGRITRTPRATVRVWADGVMRFETEALDRPVRMPSGFLARRWQIEVEGTAPIMAVTMAGSIEDLAA